MPPIEDLENPIDKYASQVISVDLKPLGTYAHSKENRIYVSYQDLSPHIIHALIATEDARFVDHSGIDAYALARAIIKRGILMQKSGGGGSTISQQLAKLLYSPSVGSLSERLLQKPIEWVIAVKLEKYYTKEEIVSMYLNKFDFLYNAVGIKSASWVYFGKEPKDLLVEEAATLVGMCKNPSYYNPIRKIERTKGRRDVVLNLMYKNKFISQTQKDSLQQIPLTTNFNRVDHKDGLAPYFREYLRLMMTAQKPNSEHYSTWQKYKFAEDSLAWETNPVYGWCNKNTKSNGQPYNIYTDGLKIYTNIDSRMQTYAEESVKEHIGDYLQDIFFKEKSGRDYAPFSKSLKKTDMEAILERSMKQTKRYEDLKKENYSDIEISKIFNNEVEMTVFSWKGLRDTTMTPMDSIRYMKSFLRAGFAAMDPKTGAVKAYVGGIDYKYFQYDMVNMGRRQIGSTIKPYLYALAMEEGFTPCDEVLHVEQELVDENGRLYIPRNANKKNVGEMVSIKWGLQNSDNWVTAYLMKQLSPYVLARLLHSFGLQGQIDPVVSLCLGPCDASVGEMVSAYSAFANGGVRAQMSCVSRIEDGMGNVLATFTPQSSEVLSEEATYKTLHMLRAVVDGGTGGRIRRYGISAPMGGKTGTSQNNSDGWFMGFTPSLVGGVWVGGEDRSIHFDRMAEGQAAAMALPIFGIFMKKVYADKSLGYSQTENFEVPYIYANPCAGGSEMRDLSTPKLEDEIFE
ncbi:penicillin-binding protein 1A [Bacteroidales bacterium]|nr:penicillin-binding protein 1A [Bacteroidales bacterium]